ncbi:hypothetical protein K8I28_08135 [bacterium]|nr:hypothetical protein [bacterium]
MANPFKAFMDIRREEIPFALLMFSYFFLVITSFWILKPIKKILFIQFYDTSGFDLFGTLLRGSQAELLAKVLNMVVAFLAVIVFTWLSRKYVRQQLTFIFTGFFCVSYLVFGTLLPNPNDGVVWSFYLFGDLFSTLMVATFFTFMNDSVSAGDAKRLYGLVGLGGVLGGVFGASFVRLWIDQVSHQGWLIICLGIGLAIAVIAFAAGKIVEKRQIVQSAIPTNNTNLVRSGNPAFEGAKLVFKSRYLLSIVAIVGLYEILSQVLDFQFTSTIEHFLDGDEIGHHFATVYSITNWFSFLVQLFLTSFIMTRFSLTAALFMLPAAILLSSAGFMIMPVLWAGSILNIADNGFSYSINQSAKETLYVPTSRDEKYKAKAFIDMFVQRFAKAIAVGVSLLITTIFSDFSSIRWLSLFTVAVVVLWMYAVLYAGRKFKEITKSQEKQP